jgi:hypothetical protein
MAKKVTLATLLRRLIQEGDDFGEGSVYTSDLKKILKGKK